MQLLNQLIEAIRGQIRRIMQLLARLIDKLGRGKIGPDTITITSLLMHIPIAWLIAQGYFGYGALLLIFFGLFDVLDGELARLQKKASSAGMLLDATTDRMKEVLIYIGAAYVFVLSGQPYGAVWATAALGGSLLVSYVKAKGETALSDSKLSVQEKNRVFTDGLMRFEIRTFIFIVGLVLNQLLIVVVIITVLSWLSAFERLIKIRQKL